MKIRRNVLTPPLLILLFLLCHVSSTSTQESVSHDYRVIPLTGSDDSYWPSWSPDGSRIAYFKRVDDYVKRWERDTREPICNLWIMNADGTDAHELWGGSARGDYGLPLWSPQWSGDGSFIAIDQIREPSSAIVLDSHSGQVVLDSLSTRWCRVPRFAPSEALLVLSQLTPSWIGGTDGDMRSIMLLDVRTGESKTIYQTRYNAESEWNELPSNWSTNGRLIRVRDRSRYGKWGRLYYIFIQVETGEVLYRSLAGVDPTDLPDTFRDLTLSTSTRWQVVAPRINDEEEWPDLRGNAWLRKGLTINRIGPEGLEDVEYRPETEGAYIYSYQWHPTLDRLLVAAGEKSLDPEEAETSNIYTVILPD